MAAKDNIDPAILANWIEVAEQRGLSLSVLADQVQPESALLADALREVDAERGKKRAAAEPKKERAVKTAATEKRG